MRIGTNPNAEAVLPKFPEVVACVITHLPNRNGYHSSRDEVIVDSIRSMRDNTGLTVPLLIWDNGSDWVFSEHLDDHFCPDYMIKSPNIGKASARTAITRMFPPSTILAVSDDDIYYEPNWLEPQLDLLRNFPNVGVVSGCPVRTQFRFGSEFTKAWARENAVLEVGRFIPDEYEYDFCRSIGRDFIGHMNETMEEQDYRVTYNGRQAYCTSHHMQLVGYAGTLASLPIWTDKAMHMERTFEAMLDQAGLLRLTTIKRYARHIGNVPETFE